MIDPTLPVPAGSARKSGPKPSAGERYPGGKLKPFKAPAPVMVRRMLEAARAGAADPLLATPVGWLMLQRRLTPLQVSAAQAYALARTRYDQAIDAPPRTSASPSYGAAASEAGRALTPDEETAHADRAKRRFHDLRLCFPARQQSRIIALLDRTCIEQAHPALFEQAELADALSRLAVHFRLAPAMRGG